jgi:putative tryptophan/tyrosine transport system substrate-binding protein
MKRREFITLLGGAAAAWPLAARAQGKLPTIGYLGGGAAMTQRAWLDAFVQRLRELGWIEGRTVAIEYRWADGRTERFAEIAAEFVRLKVDVIVTYATLPVLAAKQATSVIPIVFATAGDPVGTGLVASMARPGGNVTGLANQTSDTSGKKLEFLREVVPVFAGWRSWPMSAILPPCWKCARFRQRPARSALRSLHPKSGERRISRPPSRRSKTARMHFIFVPTRS